LYTRCVTCEFSSQYKKIRIKCCNVNRINPFSIEIYSFMSKCPIKPFYYMLPSCD
jgi:hypothetical protein